MSGQKLADGNYICRKNCGKKCFKELDKVSAHLPMITEHIAQIEKGTKIWNEVLLPLKKSKSKDEKLVEFGTSGGADLYVSPSTGLVALVETHYKIFIFGKYQKACVYRITLKTVCGCTNVILSRTSGRILPIRSINPS